jgi:hypothetical protein
LVEKIECKNHLLRTLSRRPTDKAQLKRVEPCFGDIESRKILGDQIADIQKGMTMAIKHHKTKTHLPLRNRIQMLLKDIINAAYNYVGDHSNCEQYYCQLEKGGEHNNMPKNVIDIHLKM